MKNYSDDLFLDPDPEGLMQALEELDYLAALDNDGNLSEMGIIMSEFPLEPQMAKTLLASCEFDCISEVVVIAAMLAGNTCHSIAVHFELGQLLNITLFLCIFSTSLHDGSAHGPETRIEPLPHEVPAPRGRPLHPHQHLQGL